MKAVILAAGKGTRLASAGITTPKPMIAFRGKPVLLHAIELCKRHGITEVYVNTHHLAEQITAFFLDGKKFGVSIHYSYEPELLGTAGAVKNFAASLGSEPFFVLYGDNYSDFNLAALKTMNDLHGALGTIAFHYRQDTAASGVAEFQTDGRITKFLEKPKAGQSESHWVNAGIYFFEPSVLEHIPTGASDFGNDIFPALLKKGLPLYGVCERVPVLAFDTPELLKQSTESNAKQ